MKEPMQDQPLIDEVDQSPLLNTGQHSWYVANTGNHQGLVIEEAAGRTIAVAYDKQDAPLLAAAPCLLEALENLVNDWERVHGAIPQDHEARAALAKAKGQP